MIDKTKIPWDELTYQVKEERDYLEDLLTDDVVDEDDARWQMRYGCRIEGIDKLVEVMNDEEHTLAEDVNGAVFLYDVLNDRLLHTKWAMEQEEGKELEELAVEHKKLTELIAISGELIDNARHYEDERMYEFYENYDFY